jgi:hypothetical protein
MPINGVGPVTPNDIIDWEISMHNKKNDPVTVQPVAYFEINRGLLGNIILQTIHPRPIIVKRLIGYC